MANLHTPERAANESRADYIARRKASAAAVKVMTAHGIGSQRNKPSSRQQLRDSQRSNGHGPKGVYGANLMRYFNRKLCEAAAARLQRRALA
jgi:hypothetical protein